MTSSLFKSRSLFLYCGGGGGGGGKGAGVAAALLDRRLLTSTILQSSPFTTSAAASGRPIDGSSSSSFHQSQEKERGILSKLFLFIPGAIAFGLGSWQIFRRQDKVKMLEYRQTRLEMPPMNLSGLSTVDDLQSSEFRRVVCKGVFDEKKSIFVGPRSRSISGVTENGYYIITPLIPVPGDPESVQLPVLVNRGWVPRSLRDKFFEANKDVEQHTEPSPTTLQVERNPWWKIWSKKSERNEKVAPEATILKEVVGVVRGSEKPSIFVPANDPSSGQWFYVDVPAISDACGLPQNTIYLEDIDSNVNPSNPYPIPKDVNALIRTSVMPQDHLNYIITWYSLSTAVTVMAYKRLKTTKKVSR